MKTIVTGGCGFIGSHLVRELLNRNHQVTVIDPITTGDADRLPSGVELIPAMPSETRAAGFMGKEGDLWDVDVIFHLGAQSGVGASIANVFGCVNDNVTETVAVMKCAGEYQVKRVVFASSSSVYGAGSKDGKTAETFPIDPRSPYAASKVAGEAFVKAFSHLYGTESVILRPFNVYGPEQTLKAPLIPNLFRAAMKGEKMPIEGTGRQERDFTFVDDVVRAFLLVGEAKAEDVDGWVFNVCAGKPVPLLSVADMVWLASGQSGGPKIDHLESRPGDVPKTCGDNTKLRHLGWKPLTRLEVGIKETAEFWKK